MRLDIMNEVIEKHLKEFQIKNITHLNGIHYTATITLIGGKEKKEPREKKAHNSQQYIRLKINKIRKWIGRLTAAKEKILTPKLKKFIKKDTIENALQKQKMRLAAL